MSPAGLAAAALAAAAAGVVNALAGGGTLITFPVLVAAGLPAVSANVTSTVALCPGYLGAVFGQARDLRGQGARARRLIPAAVIAGIAGGALLLASGERLFRELVPYLILLASGLLALQGRLRSSLAARRQESGRAAGAGRALVPVGLAAVYGGYFGAGVSVLLLAALGLAFDDTLTRLNALKQALALAINLAAAAYFLASGRIEWETAAVMAAAALLGGYLGGRLAGRARPEALRFAVVAIGIVVGVVYLVR